MAEESFMGVSVVCGLTEPARQVFQRPPGAILIESAEKNNCLLFWVTGGQAGACAYLMNSEELTVRAD